MRAFVKTRVVADSNKMATRLAWTIGLLAIALRFVAITQPFIDSWSWRESDVAAIARNFFENGFRFAYPQIDWAGDAAGYVGTEFPLLPFAVALFYRIRRGARMVRTSGNGFVFCRFAAVFLSAGATHLQRNGRRVGARFLQFRTAQHRREPRFPAGFPVAYFIARRTLFFSALV